MRVTAPAPTLFTNLLDPVPVASTTALVRPEPSPARLAVMAPVKVRLPAPGVPPPAPAWALRLLTVDAPSDKSLVSTSDTVPALGIEIEPKLLVVPVSVKLPPPNSARLRPDALNTPPDSVLVAVAASPLSAVTATVRLPRLMSLLASSVPPASVILPEPSPDRAWIDSVPAFTVVPPLKVFTAGRKTLPLSVLVRP